MNEKVVMNYYAKAHLPHANLVCMGVERELFESGYARQFVVYSAAVQAHKAAPGCPNDSCKRAVGMAHISTCIYSSFYMIREQPTTPL